MKSMIQIFKRAFPQAFLKIKSLLGRLYLDEINRMIFDEFDGRVADGPFFGMRYIEKSNGSSLSPKILGSYEKELHTVLRTVLRTPYEAILDIGAAEGYYAVGFALKHVNAHVFAYDIDPDARANLSELSSLNAVANRVTIGSECNAEILECFAAKRCLVFCDIGGFE